MKFQRNIADLYKKANEVFHALAHISNYIPSNQKFIKMKFILFNSFIRSPFQFKSHGQDCDIRERIGFNLFGSAHINAFSYENT